MFIVAGALVLIVLSGLWGWAVASNPEYKKYPFLSDFYNEKYIPTQADWEAVQYNSLWNHEISLTAKLLQTSHFIMLYKDSLVAMVDTETQPSWDVYLGEGRFSVSDRELRGAYREVADGVLNCLRIFFPEEKSDLTEQEITMLFCVHGYPVGSWKGGVFKLEGEK